MKQALVSCRGGEVARGFQGGSIDQSPSPNELLGKREKSKDQLRKRGGEKNSKFSMGRETGKGSSNGLDPA